MNVFDLFARISLDSSSFEKSLDEAGKKSTSFIDKLGNGFATAAKAGAVAIGATSTAVGALAAQSVKAFSEFEQLEGGVQTLFKDSADQIMQYADAAYQTAGISANQYMETVTSFSASLIQSLGGDTQEAAEYANMAIIDMSDNANKMGTSMESIQNAYQGFAKQNYTMLDNLKLGYGGTAQEMYRLLQDAAKLDDTFAQTAEFSMDASGHLTAGYADIVQAIHIVQDEMGIANTTQEEAAKTVEGSVGSMKAAWDNLVTGFARDDADLEGLIEKVVVSAETAFTNIAPVVEKALSGIAEGINTVMPILIEQLPKALEVGVSIIESVSQSILENIPAILPALVDLVMSISQMFIEHLPLLVDTGIEIITQLMNGLTNALPSLMSAIANVIVTIATKLTDPDTILSFVNAALQMLIALADGFVKAIPVIVKALPQIIDNIIKSLLGALPVIIQAGITLFVALVDAMPEIIQTIVGVLPQIIDSIITNLLDNLPLLIDAGMELFLALITAMPEVLVEIAKAIPQITTTVVEALLKGVGKIAEAGGKLIGSLISGAKQKISGVAKMVSGIVSVISEGIGKAISGAITWGKDMIDNFISGIKNAATGVTDAIGDVAESIKGLLGFSEPDFGPLSNFHTYAPDMMRLFTKGIKDNEKLVLNQIKDSFDFSDLIGGLNPTAELSLATANTALRASTAQSGSTVPIVLNIDGRTLAKVLYPYNTAESQRRGLTIVTGG